MSNSHPGSPSTLPLSRISAGYNPRRHFDAKKHAELVASMRLRGMLQPMLLRPADQADLFVIVAGGRRYRAALEAFGPEGQVPVIIRAMTDQEALEAAIDENDVRDDASETEQADAAVRVLAACQGDRAEAARRLGWSRAKLDRRLALAELSDAVKLALDERRIKVGHAELLAAVPSTKQDRALETIIGSGLDVAKTRDLLMRITQDLAGAVFDKAECTRCPYNSASQRTLFETHIDDGHCTNPGCFELKTEAAERIAQEARERISDVEADEVSADDETNEIVGDDGQEGEPILDVSDEAAPGRGDQARPADPARPGAPATTPAAKPPATASATARPSVTPKSIAARTAELREATWRTALARTLAGHAGFAHTAILVAAMSGTLPQIKAETLRARAGLLVDAGFPNLDYRAQIEAIRGLGEPQAATVLSAIGAAYARDVANFGHVADLARAFAVDLRDAWQVDQAFLERYTKDELKFLAQECGLMAHLGEKVFARFLAGKKAELIAGMLNATGFDWVGRLPSAMTLDGRYGPPHADRLASDEAHRPTIAA